jgi:peptidyl-prolyl cis-trans isomerase SurA
VIQAIEGPLTMSTSPCSATVSPRTSPRRTVAASAALLLLTMVMAGCHREHSADVVAIVNGHAILRTDMDKMYQAQLASAQQPPSPDEAEGLKLSSVRELIDEEIVTQRAAKMNLTASNEEVDAKLNEMKAPYTEEAFAAQLQAKNLTMDDLRHNIRRALTIDKLLNKEINSKITVTDADVSSYYNQHKAEFNLISAQYRLAQIQVTDQTAAQPGNLQNSKASSDAEARKKIQALKNRVDSGEDFGAIAMNFSEDPRTASSGGDMGFVDENQLRTDPQVFAALSKLKPGQTTDVLPLVDPQTHKVAGYAIYKLVSREAAGQRNLSDPSVQQHIRQQLRDGRSQLLKNAYFEMLRDQAKVENFYAEQIIKNVAR